MQQNPHPRACTGVTELCLLKSKSNSLPTETTSQSKGKQLQKRMNRLQHIDQISQAAKMIRRTKTNLHQWNCAVSTAYTPIKT